MYKTNTRQPCYMPRHTMGGWRCHRGCLTSVSIRMRRTTAAKLHYIWFHEANVTHKMVFVLHDFYWSVARMWTYNGAITGPHYTLHLPLGKPQSQSYSSSMAQMRTRRPTMERRPYT